MMVWDPQDPPRRNRALFWGEMLGFGLLMLVILSALVLS